jgi:hypothetical protein
MAKSFDQKAVLFKTEATEGTDSLPTGAANSIRTVDYTPTFMDAEQRTRNIDTAFKGAKPAYLYAIKRGAQFGVEMAGAGTATGIPAWMLLNKMARFGSGVVGASSVVQSLAATAESQTHYAAFLDEVNAANSFLAKTIGGRSTLGFVIEDDDFPRFNYGYLGRAPALLGEEGAMPVSVVAGQAAPVMASTENTTFTLGGFALPLRRVEMNSNAELALRSLIGPQDSMAYSDDAWGGTIVGELPSLAAKNYFTNIRPGTMMPMQIVHGIVAGNIVQIDAPQVQISGNVSLTNEQGKVMLNMPVTLVPNAGNDEIVFTSK